MISEICFKSDLLDIMLQLEHTKMISLIEHLWTHLVDLRTTLELRL